MKAIQFNSFGGPEVLNLVDLPTPTADADSAIVQVKAASVNPSDVKNLSGHFSHTTLPRTKTSACASRSHARKFSSTPAAV